MSATVLFKARLLTLLGAAALFVACREAAAPAVVRDGSVSVEMRDYRFQPQAIRTSADRVRIEVVNRGRLPHALRLRLRGQERLSIPTVLPGRRAVASARLEPGSYRMVCPIGNHEELGMYGVLVVR
jgi:plastocyanin